MSVCKHCHLGGEGKYCFNCGEIYQPGRITVHSILHEVIHTFTHADKGFFYTLKNLAIHPGTMQKNYLEGERKTNQKPFSLFFICATITAIALHFLNAVPHHLQSNFDIARENFYKNYYVALQTILLPFYAFVVWILFGNKLLNYAETLVLTLYTVSVSLLIIIPLNFVSLAIEFNYEQYLELLFLSIYMIWTNINFFCDKKRWMVIVKSIVVLLLSYSVAYFMESRIINFII